MFDAMTEIQSKFFPRGLTWLWLTHIINVLIVTCLLFREYMRGDMSISQVLFGSSMAVVVVVVIECVGTLLETRMTEKKEAAI